MSDMQRRLKAATDKKNWAARGASFMAKAKATKAVWFPPTPTKTGKKTTKAKKATKRATNRATNR